MEWVYGKKNQMWLIFTSNNYLNSGLIRNKI